jgi:hypothetical protein
MFVARPELAVYETYDRQFGYANLKHIRVMSESKRRTTQFRLWMILVSLTVAVAVLVTVAVGILYHNDAGS